MAQKGTGDKTDLFVFCVKKLPLHESVREMNCHTPYALLCQLGDWDAEEEPDCCWSKLGVSPCHPT